MKSKKLPVVELHKVEKIYDLGAVKVNALAGVSMAVNEGEFVSIIGPSGSGKSTLMGLVGALDLPTFGMVKLNGENISQMSESDLAVLRGKTIGFVFQKFNLINALSAVENVELPLIFSHVPKSERRTRALEMLARVGLAKRADHRPVELSGGEQQRVAIARALVVNPSLILADEPTGNLDSKTGADVLNLFKELNAEGKTLVLVTHDMNVAAQASRIVKIKDGLIESENYKLKN